MSSATPISKLKCCHLYTKSIVLDIAHKFLRQRKRSAQQVNADYDQGEWANELKAKRWLNADSLKEYVIPNSDRLINATIDGRLTKISITDYYAYRTTRLAQTLSKYDLNTGELVELGSGTGRNLFALATTGHWPKLRGYELSRTGIQVAQSVSKHFNLENVQIGHINLLDPQSEGFSELKDATAFTFYCLEQLPDHVEVVIRNLVNAGIKRVIHIEPTLELFSRRSVKDLATISYVWRQNYLKNLVTVAQKLEQEGLIKIVDVCRLNFAPTLRNDPTLVVWEPASGSKA